MELESWRDADVSYPWEGWRGTPDEAPRLRIHRSRTLVDVKGVYVPDEGAPCALSVEVTEKPIEPTS